MKAVLTCRLSSGEEIEITPMMFGKVNFKDAKILSGEKYYIQKAVSLGAEKPTVKRKTKAS